MELWTFLRPLRISTLRTGPSPSVLAPQPARLWTEPPSFGHPEPMPAFAQVLSRWQMVCRRPLTDVQLGCFFEDLTAVKEGPPPVPGSGKMISWFQACRHLAGGRTNDPDERVALEMWGNVSRALRYGGTDGGSDPMRSALLLLDCARALRHSPDEIPSRVPALSIGTPRPVRPTLPSVLSCAMRGST